MINIKMGALFVGLINMYLKQLTVLDISGTSINSFLLYSIFKLMKNIKPLYVK